jgi:MazG family protein
MRASRTPAPWRLARAFRLGGMTGKDGAAPGTDAEVSARIDRLNAKAASAEPLNIEDLLALMAVLRDPTRGCPWDRQQSFASIAPYTIEEAYEVADAIARGDLPGLKEELGDLLLQVAYHAQMAGEDGHFDFAGVADAITRKMIRRHPHVFGDEEMRAGVEIRGLWERIKAEEAKARQAASETPPGGSESVLDGVTAGLPALSRSVKLQKRAAGVGFDWPEPAQMLDKIREELAEFERELGAGQRDGMEDELGDLFFVLANLSRRLSIDPEAAIRRANAKFERRFRHIERRLRETGRDPGRATLDEMETLWREAKALEKSGD